MARRDIVCIGASAGGFDALRTLAGGLPADFPAAVLVVMHVASTHRSELPEILSGDGPLRARHARHGERIEPGRIYVAPPDRHLVVRDRTMELSSAPRENRSRPAIDALFRSAARAYGGRVIGVLLSGMQGDGVMGLMVIRSYGGTTLVQSPRSDEAGEMPRRAVRYANVDDVLPLSAIAPMLDQLVRKEVPTESRHVVDGDARAAARIREDLELQAAGTRRAQPSTYTCPDCHGTLWEMDAEGERYFRCHVGHRFAPDVLLDSQNECVETALWSAVRLFVERATLSRELAGRLRVEGLADRADTLEEQARQDEHHLRVLRDAIDWTRTQDYHEERRSGDEDIARRDSLQDASGT